MQTKSICLELSGVTVNVIFIIVVTEVLKNGTEYPRFF